MTVQTRPSPTSAETRLVSLITADEYRLLPETNKICELINGEIVMAPAPRMTHQLVVGNLYELVQSFLRREQLGFAFAAPFDVFLNTYEVYQPDIVVVLREHSDLLTEEGFVGMPGVVVEVLSPSNRRNDLVTKAAEYAAGGVPEYWVVDPAIDRIEINRLQRGVYLPIVSTDGIARSVALPGFEVTPADIFAMPAWMTRPTSSTVPEEG